MMTDEQAAFIQSLVDDAHKSVARYSWELPKTQSQYMVLACFNDLLMVVDELAKVLLDRPRENVDLRAKNTELREMVAEMIVAFEDEAPLGNDVIAKARALLSEA